MYISSKKRIVCILVASCIILGGSFQICGCGKSSKKDTQVILETESESIIEKDYDAEKEDYFDKMFDIFSNIDENDAKRKNRLEVQCIMQNPELPSGCEITSLAIDLNYLGIPAEKTDLASNYLNCSNEPKGNPNEVFVGNPFMKVASYGCYSRVIADTAVKYITAKGYEAYEMNNMYSNSWKVINDVEFQVINLTGQEFTTFFDEIDNGYPVILWSTIDQKESGKEIIIGKDASSGVWRRGEHCVVLTGYDMENRTVDISDPLKGNITIPMETAILRYLEQYSQAVVIRKVYKNG